jgi:hypothetical protein
VTDDVQKQGPTDWKVVVSALGQMCGEWETSPHSAPSGAKRFLDGFSVRGEQRDVPQELYVIFAAIRAIAKSTDVRSTQLALTQLKVAQTRYQNSQRGFSSAAPRQQDNRRESLPASQPIGEDVTVEVSPAEQVAGLVAGIAAEEQARSGRVPVGRSLTVKFLAPVYPQPRPAQRDKKAARIARIRRAGLPSLPDQVTRRCDVMRMVRASTKLHLFGIPDRSLWCGEAYDRMVRPIAVHEDIRPAWDAYRSSLLQAWETGRLGDLRANGVALVRAANALAVSQPRASIVQPGFVVPTQSLA